MDIVNSAVLKHDKVIEKISSLFAELKTDEIDIGIQKSLEIIGKFLKIDHCYLVLFAKNNMVKSTIDWHLPKIKPQLDYLTSIYDNLPSLNKVMKKSGMIYFPDTNSIATKTTNNWSKLVAKQVKSFVNIELTVHDEYIGFTGFSTIKKQKTWQKSELLLIKIFNDLIANILQRKYAEETCEKLSKYDSLTQLPNRFQLDAITDLCIGSAIRHNKKLALFSINLDDFKDINETYGHDVGDMLLQQVGGRLKNIIRSEDIVARTGADEFVVIAVGLNKPSETGIIAQKLFDCVKSTYSINSNNIAIKCSIGIAYYPIDGNDRRTLIKNASIAMHKAKSLGKNNFCYFTKSIKAAREKELSIENALKSALEKNEFHLVYQPQFNVQNQIIGMEALIRWESDKLGSIPPMEFIQIAENRGLIIPIGNWVLQTAGQHYLEWKKSGLFDGQKIAINLSFRQFENNDLSETLSAIFREKNIPTRNFELELTETVLMHDPEFAKKTLASLCVKGFSVAIDDFGTGYSSLYYLKNLPIQRLKIDRSFVSSIGTEKGDDIIVDATISLAKKLGLEIIAEGVETQKQLQFLTSHGCTQFQGYYFSKPIKKDEMGLLLKKFS